MNNNVFVHFCYDFIRKEWYTIPRFRSMSPYKNPKWFINHPELVDICDWVELNILHNIESLTYITLGVLIRIATGMLYKCTSIDDPTKTILHHNMITFVYDQYSKSLTKDLPF